MKQTLGWGPRMEFDDLLKHLVSVARKPDHKTVFFIREWNEDRVGVHSSGPDGWSYIEYKTDQPELMRKRLRRRGFHVSRH